MVLWDALTGIVSDVPVLNVIVAPLVTLVTVTEMLVPPVLVTTFPPVSIRVTLAVHVPPPWLAFGSETVAPAVVQVTEPELTEQDV